MLKLPNTEYRIDLFQVLESLPRDAQTLPELQKLKTFLEEDSETGGQRRINRITTPTTGKNDLIQIEPVLAGKRQLLHLTDSVAPTLNQSL